MNRPVVFDTNLLSYVIRRDPRRGAIMRLVEANDAIISFQTYGELWHGAFKAQWGLRRKGELVELLEAFTVHHTDDDMVMRWAQLRADQERRGLPLSIADAWIVATALVLDCPLVTNDQGVRRAEVPGLVVWGVVGEEPYNA